MIKIKDVSKTYDDLKVLKSVNLDIKKGETVVIIGPSGSGKSTLLRCINMLAEPFEGSILINDEDINSGNCNVTTMRQKVGMVFQSFNLFEHMKVINNITYAPIKTKKMNEESAVEKAEQLLKQVGLFEKRDVYPHNLSGGQKQRVAIARALAMDPEVILFDEPTSALDAEMVKEVLDVIKSLAPTGITSVIVTHELGFAREVADTIVFMDNGEIIEVNNSKDFFENPKTNRAKDFLATIL